jgi:hypothetical protein
MLSSICFRLLSSPLKLFSLNIFITTFMFPLPQLFTSCASVHIDMFSFSRWGPGCRDVVSQHTLLLSRVL